MLVGVLGAVAFAAPLCAQDEYLYLTSHFDTDGFDEHSGIGAQGFDGNGRVFPVDCLPKGRQWVVRSSWFGKVQFLRPPTSEGSKNFVSCRGQTLPVKTKRGFRSLLVLGATHRPPPPRNPADFAKWQSSMNRLPTGSMRVEYDDGATVDVPFGLSYWDGPSLFGEEAIIRTKSPPPKPAPGGGRGRAGFGGDDFDFEDFDFSARLTGGRSQIRMYLMPVPVDGQRVVRSVRLPDHPLIKIAAITMSGHDLSSSRASTVSKVEPADVAIFDEPGFPVFDPVDLFDASVIAKRFARHDLRAAVVGLGHLSDPAVVSAERFSVLVLPHGGCYPAAAREALIAYRNAGGSIVVVGPPLDLEVSRGPLNTWILQLDPAIGMGVAVAGIPAAPTTKIEMPRALYQPVSSRVGTALSAEWGIPSAAWTELDEPPDGYRFGIHASSLPDGAQLQSLVDLQGSGYSLGAVVTTKRDGGATSRDVILSLGELSRNGARHSELATELIVRAAAFCLREQGEIDAERWAAIATPFESGSIEYPAVPAVASEPFAGVALDTKLEGALHTVDVSELSDSDRVLLSSAQGLLQRSGVAVWLDEGRAQPALAFPTLPNAPKPPSPPEAPDSPAAVAKKLGLESPQRWTPKDVLGALPHRRAVIVDPALPPTLNAATMIASVESLLVAYPGAIDEYELEVAADLRGLFEDQAEMLEFVRSAILPRLDPDLIAIVPATADSWRLRDLLVSRRALVLTMPSYVARSRVVYSARSPWSRVVPEQGALVAGMPFLTPVLFEQPSGDDYAFAGSSFGGSSYTIPPWVTAASKGYGKLPCGIGPSANVSLRVRADGPARRPEIPATESDEIDIEDGKLYVVTTGRRAAGGAYGNSIASSSARFEAQIIRMQRMLEDADPGAVRRGDREKPAPPPVELELGLDRVDPITVRHTLEDLRTRVVGIELPWAGELVATSAGRFAPVDHFGWQYGPGREQADRALSLFVAKELVRHGGGYVEIAPGDGARDSAGRTAVDGDSLEAALARELPEGAFLLRASSASILGSPAGVGGIMEALQFQGDVPVLRTLGLGELQAFAQPGGVETLRSVLPQLVAVSHAELGMLTMGGLGGRVFPGREVPKTPLEDVIVEIDPRQVVAVAKKLRARGSWKRHELMPAGSEWKFHDGGVDLGTEWRRRSFDDSGWKSGAAELGYGDEVEGRPEATQLSFGGNPQQKHPCYYFRRDIVVEKAPEWKLVLAEVVADDGCVVYLNGKEIFRRGMPEGDIEFSTLATGAFGGQNYETVFQSEFVPSSSFLDGKNVIAVEVHQGSPSSSDVSFDFRLSAFSRER